MHPLQQGPSRQGWQTELQQHAALQRQAARRQPAGRSGQPFRTPTAAGRRREGPRGRMYITVARWWQMVPVGALDAHLRGELSKGNGDRHR